MLLAFEKSKWYFYLLSGFLLGLSFVMKQSGIFFPVFGGLMILLYPLINKEYRLLKGFKNLLVYAAGTVIPLWLAISLRGPVNEIGYSFKLSFVKVSPVGRIAASMIRACLN